MCYILYDNKIHISITYRNDRESRETYNQSVQYKQNECNTRIEFLNILWKNNNILMFFNYLSYHY